MKRYHALSYAVLALSLAGSGYFNYQDYTAPMIPGVEIKDEERAICQANGCTVWSNQQLENVARHFYREGYTAGSKSL